MSDLLDRLKTALSDRYAIERELGAGGMATVYLADDLKHERQVAVKVLRPELAAALGPERFLREIKTTARLNHPHILTLLDSGEADGFLYYVMPFVEGESLRDRLNREKQLPLDDALQFAREVADALSYAHSHDVIHRDIKPENILLSAGHAVVADFGIATAVTAAGGERLTDTGIVVGTPVYMSPEQGVGSGEVDGRSDTYSLGCVVYEMLAGHPPFTGTTAQEVLARHSMDSVPSLAPARPSVGHGLDSTIRKALAKVRADRFSTTTQFATALGRSRVASTPPSLVEGSSMRSRRWVIGAVASAIAALLVVAIALWPTGSSALIPNRVAVGLFENRTGDADLDYVGSMAADWITRGLLQTGIVDVIPSPTALNAWRFVQGEIVAGRMSDPISGMAEEVNAGTVVSGSYYREGDAIRFEVQVTDALRERLLGAPDPVTGSLESPQEAIERLGERVMGFLTTSFDDRLQSYALSAGRAPTHQAYRAFSEGLDAFAQTQYQTAYVHFLRAYELDSTFPTPLLYGAMSQFYLGAFVGNLAAMDSVLRRVAAVRNEVGEYNRSWVDYLQALVEGDDERALNSIRRAAQIAPESQASYNLAVAAINTNRPRLAVQVLTELDPERGAMRGWFPYWRTLTEALHMTEEYQRELAVARQALAIHPQNMFVLSLEVRALAGLGRADQAMARLDTAATWSRFYGFTGPGTGGFGDILLNGGRELKAHGHPAAAADVLDRALEWYRETSPDQMVSIDHPAAQNPLLLAAIHESWLGVTLNDAERWEESETVHRRLLSDYADAIAETPGNQIWLNGNFGIALAAQGKRDEVVAIDQWLMDLDNPYLSGVRTWNRARLAGMLGEREQAVALMRQAFEGGFSTFRLYMHVGVEYAPLRGYAPFEELLRPKG